MPGAVPFVAMAAARKELKEPEPEAGALIELGDEVKCVRSKEGGERGEDVPNHAAHAVRLGLQLRAIEVDRCT